MLGLSLSLFVVLGVELLYILPPVYAIQWTIKSWAVLSSVPTTGFDGSSVTFDTTLYLTSPTPTPTAKPYSSDVDVLTGSNHTYITYYLNADAVPGSILAATRTRDYGDIVLTYFYQPVEYTAPASCPTPFTYTSSTYINVPAGAEYQVTPTSVTTTVRDSTDTVVSAYLTPNAVPLDTPPSTTDFIYEEYVASCSNPATTSDPYSFGVGYPYPTSSSYYGGYYSGGDDDYYNDANCIGKLCPFWLIYIIIFCTLIPLMFILGLFESYFWFSRLMKGQFAFRGVPLFWVCISLWALCCLRRARHARPDQQATLEKQWRGMSTSKRLGLWMKYGFRHRNPPEIDTIIASSQQQMGYGPGGVPPYQMPGSQPYYPGQQPYYPPPGQQPYYQPQGPQQYYPASGQPGSPDPSGGQYATVQRYPGAPLQRAGYPPPTDDNHIINHVAPYVQNPNPPQSPAQGQPQQPVSPVQQLYAQQDQRSFSPVSSNSQQPRSPSSPGGPVHQPGEASTLEVTPQQKPQETAEDPPQPVTSVQEVSSSEASRSEPAPHTESQH